MDTQDQEKNILNKEENQALTGSFGIVNIFLAKITHSDCRKVAQWGFILPIYA
ncbi:MAG: hypothetical protein AAB410_05315 [Patescibacteria group bacterium]